MKVRFVAAMAAVLGLGMTVALVALVGCDTPSTSEPESYFDDNPFSSIPRETPGDPELEISPSGYFVTNAAQIGQAVLFTAKGGRDPVTWESMVPGAGTLQVQPNGRDVLYILDTLDDNTLIARDGGGSAAIATIRGQSSALSISSSDDPELLFDSERLLLYAVGGAAPYTWSLVYPQRGRFLRFSQGQTWTEYMRVTEPDQVVILTDANGAMAELRISQPDEAAGGGSTNAASPLVATATPATLDSDGDLALCNVAGGTPPYTWTVIDPFLGTILAPNVGAQVIYQRDNAGDNAVKVTDADGSTTYIIISQP